MQTAMAVVVAVQLLPQGKTQWAVAIVALAGIFLFTASRTGGSGPRR